MNKITEDLLKEALSPTEKPRKELNAQILWKIREREKMGKTKMRRGRILLVAAAFVIATSAVVFAAWPYLTAGQVADQAGNPVLGEAFDSESAIAINETKTSGGYAFTLLGVVSGKELSEFANENGEIKGERTYAVVSIGNEDGSPMENTAESGASFFVSPLIKGVKPWQVNIASMNGGYSEFMQDGLLYRLIECDGVEMFADRGLYLCASTTNFYSIEAFDYDESTGEVTSKDGFAGANVIFDLPLPAENADPAAAADYLKQFEE